MKVSFDFDGTLTQEEVQFYAKELLDKNVEVHITTSRYSNPSSYPIYNRSKQDAIEVIKAWREVSETVKKLGIPKKHIHYTEFKDKVEWFEEHPEYNFIWHLDDNVMELLYINSCPRLDIKGILVHDKDWKEKCNKLLNY